MNAPLSSESADASPADAKLAPARRINPYKMFVGSFVPNWLLKRSEISQGAKLCYARLAQFAGEDGCCFPKQSTLAVELGIGERTTRYYIRELERFTLIESVQSGLRRANRYYFLDHSWIYDGQALVPATSGQDRQSSAALERQNSAAPTSKENHLKENQKKKYTHTPREPVSLPSSEEEAVEAAKQLGIPEDFARELFNDLAGVGWLDGSKRPIRFWSNYLKKRWREKQAQSAKRSARPYNDRSASNRLPVLPRHFTTADY